MLQQFVKLLHIVVFVLDSILTEKKIRGSLVFLVHFVVMVACSRVLNAQTSANERRKN